MARQRALVTQHLENIGRGALERYQDIVRAYIRRRPGIYALYRKDKLYYVGLARDLRVRLKSHLRDRHGTSWERFSVYLTIGDEHMRELESLVLRIVKPTGNAVKGKFGKSENLLPRLRRDVRRRLAEEQARLLGQRSRLAKFSDRGNGRSAEASGDPKPVLASYADRPRKLLAVFKGKKYRARVLRDGRIRYGGRTFTSPSQAASAVARHSCNGWWLWKYERSPGDWVRLRNLRLR